MSNRTASEWESRFRTWAGGPGDTETAKCENAERMIRKAIGASRALQGLNIDVFAQGSFKNVTNIPQESDVDVSVCLLEAFYFDLPVGTTREDFGIRPTDFTYRPYKQDVVDALSSYFGRDGIDPGNKAIRVHSNTYRVNADVVANWEQRDYFDVQDPSNYRSGIVFQADDGSWITNYPKQHIEEGILKNGRTGRRFKRMARILKSLQVEMIAIGIVTHRCPSFFLESLVFNVSDDGFNHDSYRDDVRWVLAEICNSTRVADDASQWFEVNNVKYLFHHTQPWSKAEANTFANAAWDYVGFE
jgi:hypothetical protein